MGAKGVTVSMVAMAIVLAAAALTGAQEAKPPQSPASQPPSAPETRAQAAARLFEVFKKHPIKPDPAPNRVGLHVMDVTTGEQTLLAEEPAPGLIRCGSPVWSHDGRRIAFDATPGAQWTLSHLMLIDVEKGLPHLTDLGIGTVPTFSPADDRIAWMSLGRGAQRGVWLMNADGSERRLLGEDGRPAWSPDGRQLMITNYSNPRQVTLMDADPDKSGVLQLADYQIYKDPQWASAGTIVAIIGSTEGDTVALIDVSDRSHAKIKEVLWRRANGPDVNPDVPAYSAATRRAVFVGGDIKKGQAMYSVEQGKPGPAKRLWLEGCDPIINGLAVSPDGRYILYSVQDPGPARGGPALEGRAAAKPNQTATGPTGRGPQGKIYLAGSSQMRRGVHLIAIEPANRNSSVVLPDCSSRARISPDGRHVAYEKADALWVQEIDNRPEPISILKLAGATEGSPAAWSPDGKQLVVSLGHRDEARQVWVHKTVRVNVDGSDPKELPIPPEDTVQDWSRDGNWLLTASSRGAKIGWQLYVIRPDGTEQRRLTDGGNPFYARFSPDGRRVVYTDNARGNQSGIWIVDVDGANAGRVLAADRNTTGSACWSPDGKQIAVTLSPLNPPAQANADHPPIKVEVVDVVGGGEPKTILIDLFQSDMPDWR
jgi:Tol biopolymer transport system component